MILLSKNKFKELMKLYPEGGIVFAENPCETDVLVTNGDFGARSIIPQNGEVFDFDWNIEECNDNDTFYVFENEDILQIIQTLTSGLKIKLTPWYLR